MQSPAPSQPTIYSMILRKASVLVVPMMVLGAILWLLFHVLPRANAGNALNDSPTQSVVVESRLAETVFPFDTVMTRTIATSGHEPFSLAWSSFETDIIDGVAWGDVDGDGDLDLAVGGFFKPVRLYRNDGGGLTSSAVWSSVEADDTTSLAWGDVDGDGDLDLVVGNLGQPNRLYRNDGGTLTPSAIWSSVESDNTESVAWGDVDGDGDLDLAVGNFGQPNRLYRNDGGTLTASAVWSSAEADSTYSVAWGDVDGDGDLDLAVGNWDNQPNRLYRNDGGTLTSSAVWSSVEADHAQSVAWGDVDGDGDLDLAVGVNCIYISTCHSIRLYRNDGGMLTPSAVWSSVESDYTQSVAWGDYDGDGDLDLAVGNNGQPTRLYRNDGGVLTSNAVWSSVQAEYARGVAWGDVDGDGDLDLAVVNHGQPTRLYRNEGGTLMTSAVWSSVESDRTRYLAWGDVDSDGDLDLAIGNVTQPSRLYRNDGGMLTSSAVWSSVEADGTQSVAWGDVDGDGDLDLAVGNSGQPNRLYRNDGGVLTSNAAWSSAEVNGRGIAWGDMDGDGDLDLAVGEWGQPSRLYRNDGGALTPSAVWLSIEADNTKSVAWGDVDGDGDLDLAVGNMGQPNRLYRNDGGVLTSSAVWSSVEADFTASVAWGDYDGDGDLDLAVGNNGQPTRLYRNDRGGLTPSVVWSSVEADYTTSVAWGDMDGDGDLDLATGSDGGPIRLYRNDNGVLTPSAVWSPAEAERAQSVAWGDVDGDGDLDLAVGNDGQPNRLYRNGRDGQLLPGSVPLVRVAQPGLNADLYSTPKILGSSTIPITYTLSDPQGDPVKLIRAWYSPNGGGHWLPAIAGTGTVTANLSTLSSGRVYTYLWDVAGSGFFGQSDNVVFRIQAVPAVVTGTRNATPGPYLYGAYASQTFPFRVRGTQVRVIGDTVPISNAIVYRLPAGQSGGGKLMADAVGNAFHTDSQGYLQGRGQINLGDQLLALAPVSSHINYAGALTLDGVDDYVIKNPLNAAPITETAISFWMRSDDRSGQGTPFSYATPSNADEFVITNYNNFAIYRGSINVTTGITATDGDWHHIAVTWRSADGQVEVYKDGVASYTGTLTATSIITGGSLVLGQDQGGVGGGFDPARAFKGGLGEVHIWNVALDNAQIQRDMLDPLTGHEAGLVLDWSFDAPIDYTVNDHTANHNDGTLIGATWNGQSLGGYTVYHTNGVPTENGLNTYTVTQAGVQTLTVTSTHPLMLFDLDVSLEWDAHNDPSYLPQLTADLQKASEYLYDFSNGQITLGKVMVHQNADDWISSQVVVNATNRLRPLAAQGGIVTALITDPQQSNIIYSPGQVRMGATWNRYGEPVGASDWPLALAHELSHYLLYQEDTYLGLDEHGLLIPIDTCTGSAMGDMYDPDNTEFVFDQTHWNDEHGCANTLANQTLHRTEWATNRLWYPWLVTPTIANTGPALTPFDLTTVTILDPITPTNALADPTFFIRYQQAASASSAARAFITRTEAIGRDYVIDVGSPLGGQNRVLVRGAQPGDRLCYFDQPRREYGCKIVRAGEELQLELAHDESWAPVIQVSPVNSQTIGLMIEGLTSTLQMRARLYPEYGYGGEIITLTPSSGIYSGTFHLDFPAMAGYVQVWVDEPATELDPRRETIVAFSIGGNPGSWPALRGAWPALRGAWPALRGAWPALRGAWPALRGAWPSSRGSAAPLASPGGQMLFFTNNPASIPKGNLYTIQSMASLPPLPAGKTAIGQGYSLVASPNVTQVITGSISFQYLSIDVLVEQANEDQLTIHFWNGNSWEALGTVRSPYYNTASTPSRGPGVYALLADVTTPHLEAIDPPMAINEVTTTLTISGHDFLPPVDVMLIGPTTTYTLPVLSVSPISITAIVTQGLPAHEYQVMVINRYDAPSPVSMPFALYSPSTACFYDFFASGSSKWQRSGAWNIVTLPSGEQAMTDSPAGNYDNAVPPAITATTSITTAEFSLNQCSHPVLTFRHDYVIAKVGSSQDVGRVEISTDYGATWTMLASYSGGGPYHGAMATGLDDGIPVLGWEWIDVQWKPVEIDLSAYTGTLRLRFSLEVDRYISDRGWIIDNVMVITKPSRPPIYLPIILRSGSQIRRLR